MFMCVCVCVYTCMVCSFTYFEDCEHPFTSIQLHSSWYGNLQTRLVQCDNSDHKGREKQEGHGDYRKKEKTSIFSLLELAVFSSVMILHPSNSLVFYLHKIGLHYTGQSSGETCFSALALCFQLTWVKFYDNNTNALNWLCYCFWKICIEICKEFPFQKQFNRMSPKKVNIQLWIVQNDQERKALKRHTMLSISVSCNISWPQSEFFSAYITKVS